MCGPPHFPREIRQEAAVEAYHWRPLEDCLRLMGENTIFHLIVMDEKQGFQGMLSISDILRVVASDEKARADLLEPFIFPPR
jgi:CBS domain-containing protein